MKLNENPSTYKQIHVPQWYKMESKGFCPIKAQQNYVAHLSRMRYPTLQDDIFFVGCDVI